MSASRTEQKPERAPEPRREQEPPQVKENDKLEALDEQSLDEVMRDCPL